MIETDHRPLLETIMARTLLIWGDRDAYFSVDEQKRLLAGIKGAQMNVYEGIGHARTGKVRNGRQKTLRVSFEGLRLSGVALQPETDLIARSVGDASGSPL